MRECRACRHGGGARLQGRTVKIGRALRRRDRTVLIGERGNSGVGGTAREVNEGIQGGLLGGVDFVQATGQ